MSTPSTRAGWTSTAHIHRCLIPFWWSEGKDGQRVDAVRVFRRMDTCLVSGIGGIWEEALPSSELSENTQCLCIDEYSIRGISSSIAARIERYGRESEAILEWSPCDIHSSSISAGWSAWCKGASTHIQKSRVSYTCIDCRSITLSCQANVWDREIQSGRCTRGDGNERGGEVERLRHLWRWRYADAR